MLTREALEALSKAELVELCLAMQAAIQQLETRVSELEQGLKRNSRNSHKPPSSDGLGRPPRVSSRERSGRPSGGQVGHPGKTLRMVKSPDQVVRHEPEVCAGCQTALEGVPGEVAERRQVFELPEKLYEVIEHQALAVTCPHCQTTTRGGFPAEVSQSVQYGPRMKGLMVYLQNYQLLPYERSAELIEDVVGLGLSEGTLDNARQTCAAGLTEVDTGIKTALIEAEVVGFDETGTRLAGKTAWLHTASTPELTYYRVHEKRGTEAMDAIGILPVYGGTAVHDSWASYAQYSARHALCNAHHLRELKAFAEQGHAWAGEMRALLCEIKHTVERAAARGASTLSEHQITRFTKRYRRLISQGQRANPIPMRPLSRRRLKRPPVNNLLNRLAEQEAAVLLFMHDFRVPFDNNQSERDLRMMKVKQKVSGCFRSPEGAADFCRIRSYISTLRKQGLPVLDSLCSVFTGKPHAPALG